MVLLGWSVGSYVRGFCWRFVYSFVVRFVVFWGFRCLWVERSRFGLGFFLKAGI